MGCINSKEETRDKECVMDVKILLLGAGESGFFISPNLYFVDILIFRKKYSAEAIENDSSNGIERRRL